MDFLEIDNSLICLFSGRLDGSVCSEIEHDLLRHVSDFKQYRTDKEGIYLNFDLTDVVYVSSPFLRICLMCFKTFGKDCFSVTNVSEEIHKVFHISGFADIMNVAHADATKQVF